MKKEDLLKLSNIVNRRPHNKIGKISDLLKQPTDVGLNLRMEALKLAESVRKEVLEKKGLELPKWLQNSPVDEGLGLSRRLDSSIPDWARRKSPEALGVDLATGGIYPAAPTKSPMLSTDQPPENEPIEESHPSWTRGVPVGTPIRDMGPLTAPETERGGRELVKTNPVPGKPEMGPVPTFNEEYSPERFNKFDKGLQDIIMKNRDLTPESLGEGYAYKGDAGKPNIASPTPSPSSIPIAETPNPVSSKPSGLTPDSELAL